MVAAGEEILVGQSGKVGRGLRTLAINIANAAKESDNLVGANGKVNIALKDSEGNLRSTYDIMKDLAMGTAEGSAAWNDLSNAEQTAVGSMLGGKTQFEVLTSVLSNYQTAIDATATAYDSAGSSARENERYMDSIEGRLQRFQSAWEQLSFHIISSDFLSSLLEGATKVIDILDALTKKIGAGGLIASITTLAGAFKLLSGHLGDVGAAFQLMREGESIAAVTKELDGLSKVLGVLSASIPFLATLAAVVGAVKLGEYFSFDASVERLHDYKDNLKDVKKEIEDLNKKRSDEGLSKQEYIHLQVLEAEERSLKRQIKLEKERARKGFEREVTSDSGLAGKEGLKEVTQYEEKLKKTEKAWEDLQQAILGGDDDKIQKAQDKYDKLMSDLSESSLDVAEKWESVSAEIGEKGYEKLSERGKRAYDDLHKAFVQSGTDVVEVSDAIGKLWDQLDDAQKIKLEEVDLSQFENVEDFIEYLKENNIIPVDIKFESEGEEEVEQKKIFLTEDEGSKVIFTYDDGSVKEVTNEKQKLLKSGTAKINFDIGTVSKTLKTWWNRFKTITGAGQDSTGTPKSGKDGTKATGKRKGEPGGMAWLGDEGNRQNPKPELVVGPDGAYLAGTRGWEMRELKSSDTVYTAAQTRRLLGGQQSYQFGASEIPRYAKGTGSKFRKSELKRITNKLDTWEYQLNIGSIDEKTYIKRLEKLSKQTKKITKDQYRDMKKTIHDYYEDVQKEAYDSMMVQVEMGTKTLDEITKKIQSDKRLGKDAKEELLASAQEAQLKNLGATFEAGAISFEAFRDSVDKLKRVKFDDQAEAIANALEHMVDNIDKGCESFVDLKNAGTNAMTTIAAQVSSGMLGPLQAIGMLQSLQQNIIDAQRDKYEKLLDKEQLKQKLMKAVARRNIKTLQDQIDAIDKQNEAQETQNSLLEAEAKLAEAKSKKVKVWQQGIGWAYKEDVKAVKEAQKILNETKKDAAKSHLQKAINDWQDYLSTISDQYAFDLLLQKLNMTEDEVKELTGDSTYLNDKFKANYEAVLNNCNAYELEIHKIDELGIQYDALCMKIQQLIEYYYQLAAAMAAVGEATAAYDDAVADQKAAEGELAKDQKQLKKLQTQKKNADTKKEKTKIQKKIEAKKSEIKEDKAAVTTAKNNVKTANENLKEVSKALDNLKSSAPALASGTTSASGGITLVGERGPELRVLNRGDGIIPANISRNLMALGRFTPRELSRFMNSDSHNVIWNIQKGAIVVEGASGDGEKIAREILTQLERKSIQSNYKRVM